MYKRIEAQLVLIGKTKKELALEMDISYNTLLAKLGGNSSFTLDEALRVKQLLGAHESIELLFAQRA